MNLKQPVNKPKTVFYSEIICLFQVFLFFSLVFLSIYFVDHKPLSPFWVGVYTELTQRNPEYDYTDAGRFVWDIFPGFIVSLLFLMGIYFRARRLLILTRIFLVLAVVISFRNGGIPLLTIALFFLYCRCFYSLY